ncbi:hypothetical protein AVEN_220022-1 [Araneus ventricosus]|uniref:Uncharacterized protein n=1 Tax=Araneus ventricosus TaxID=182803 RepID=A0A4Y2CRZ4_ARAVE|nr:hypothetical protein AVEN_220022-1 [Araneus ventricosus]
MSFLNKYCQINTNQFYQHGKCYYTIHDEKKNSKLNISLEKYLPSDYRHSDICRRKYISPPLTRKTDLVTFALRKRNLASWKRAPNPKYSGPTKATHPNMNSKSDRGTKVALLLFLRVRY